MLSLIEEERTIIFYESPHRLLKLLGEIETHLGADRRISVSREISKIYEEHRPGNAAELIAHYTEHPPKGEIVVCIAPPAKA